MTLNKYITKIDSTINLVIFILYHKVFPFYIFIQIEKFECSECELYFFRTEQVSLLYE